MEPYSVVRGNPCFVDENNASTLCVTQILTPAMPYWIAKVWAKLAGGGAVVARNVVASSSGPGIAQVDVGDWGL